MVFFLILFSIWAHV